MQHSDKGFNFREISLPEFFIPGKSKEKYSEQEKLQLKFESLFRRYQQEKQALEKKGEEEKKKAYAQGLEEGRREGEKLGFQSAKNQMDQAVADLQKNVRQVIQAVLRKESEILHQAEIQVTELGLQIASKVICEEIRIRPETIRSVVKKALSLVQDKDKITVQIHPEDYLLLEKDQDFWMPVTLEFKNVILEKNPRLERGGCLIETAAGNVDARRDVQISNLAETLHRVVEEAWQGESPQLPDAQKN